MVGLIEFSSETEDADCNLDKSRGFDSNLSLEIASSLEGEHSANHEDFDDFLHDPTYGVHNTQGIGESQESNIFIEHQTMKMSSKSASCGELSSSETSEEEIGNEIKCENTTEERICKENKSMKTNEVESEESEDDIEDEIIEENLISEKSDSSKEKRYRKPIRREYPALDQKTDDLKDQRISTTSVDSASTELDINRISFVEDHVPKLYSEITESSECFGKF